MEDTDLEREYAAAFDDDMRPAGLDIDDEGDEEQGQAPVQSAAPEAEPGQSGGGDAGQQPVAVALNTEPEQPAAAPAQEEDELEKKRQQLKSWEGRLKAREAELKAKAGGEETSDKLENVAENAAAGGNQALADAANAAAEAVEAGEISAEEAMKQLSEDFGEDFVKMVTAVVRVAARKEIEPVAKTVDEVVGNLNSREAREHFKAIAEKHPDFQEVGKSGEFTSFLNSLPADQKAEAERIRAKGSADEVIALIDAYKQASKPKAAPAPADTRRAEDDMESMEGVRSGGVRLPEKPTRDDFEGAWSDF